MIFTCHPIFTSAFVLTDSARQESVVVSVCAGKFWAAQPVFSLCEKFSVKAESIFSLQALQTCDRFQLASAWLTESICITVKVLAGILYRKIVLPIREFFRIFHSVQNLYLLDCTLLC